MNRRTGWTLPLAAMLIAPGVHAVQIDTDNPDLKFRWDTSFKYSAGMRMKQPSAGLTTCTGCENQDDGNRGFRRHSLTSNRIDLLTEADLNWRNYGFRISGAAWYDAVYIRASDHDSPGTFNPVSVPHPQFTQATRELHGRKAELLDAFAQGQWRLGQSTLTGRLGRHTVLYGESLFFGNNGIAGGQAPIDAIKALSVPNTQFKELIRPVPQVSATLQVLPTTAVSGYYQFRWEGTRLPAAGSYFSTIDLVGSGFERVIAPTPFGPVTVFPRQPDLEPKDSGQYGMQLRHSVESIGTDFGLYAIRYHDKTPQTYLRLRPIPVPPFAMPAGAASVYAEGVRAFGASFSRSFDAVNVAGEVSVRRNTPLVSDPVIDVGAAGNNSSNPLYAVGNSAHAQLSALATLGPSFIARESTLLAEIAWNRRTSITRNPASLAANATRDAAAVRLLIEPVYRQIAPGLDISVPFGIGYGLSGASSVVAAFSPKKGGDMSLGIVATYEQAWQSALRYTHFFGSEGAVADAANRLSFKQSLKDRNFISLVVQRTF